MDQQFTVLLNKIKGKVNSSYEKFLLFFNLYTLIKHGIVKVSYSTYLIFFLSSLYVVSPIDLIPDFIPVVGFLDDIGILGLLISRFSNLFLLAKAIMKAREAFNKREGKIFEEKECMICLVRKPDVIFKCGHKICCDQCQSIGNFRECFLCRK